MNTVDEKKLEKEISPVDKKTKSKDLCKYKITLSLAKDHPFASFCSEVKNRRIKDHDLGETLSQALLRVWPPIRRHV